MHSLRLLPAALFVATSLALIPKFGRAQTESQAGRPAGTPPTPERNLLTNANFENGANGWKLSNFGKGGTMAMDPSELRHGKPTLRIKSVGALTFAGQTVKVKPHTTYLLSGDIKVKDVHQVGGGGVAGALVMMGDSEYGSQSPHGTADWQRVTTQLNTGDKTEIRVGPGVGWWGCKVSGTGWFSDLALTELAEDPAHDHGPRGNLIVNANYEQGTYGWELINFGEDGTLQMDTTVLHDGKPTLRLDAFGEISYARQVVSVKAHTTYRLSGYVKVQDVQEIGGAGQAGANLIVGSTNIHTRAVTGTDDWQEISVEFNTQDKTAVRVGPAVGYYARRVSGTAWFSDLSLTEVEGKQPAP